jgi:integrase
MLVDLKPILANQVLAAVSAVFSWGMREEHVTENPCRLIQRNATQTRERILSDSEIPLFWHALDDVDPVTAATLKAVLLTGARPGEVCSMCYEHLKGDFWEMPGLPSDVWPGTKNAKSHRVALSAPVRALIEALADGEMPASGYVFEVNGRAMQHLERPMAKLAGIEATRPHDLRRTFASTVASLGYGRQAIDRLLNHSDRSIASVYDRHGYAEEDKRIMEAVANRIMALVKARTAGNVVPFGR